MPENKNNDSWFESLAQYLVATPTERPYIFSPKNTNAKYQDDTPGKNRRLMQNLNTFMMSIIAKIHNYYTLLPN
ncbi:hypothetical protein [Mycoplasma zalophidermidis]|uniref:Uncharacterized protein n=1 Tax=Mycoplasma zalophidermidis TaxID=398174 RepID=A0ABS6DQQ2_9MOLU|nr:hypothetical protein [Mycoplasma zalophidermidis]MBU4689440.1 hypothetical protein [Mycoplasma zalophidermidis]MBU4693317.1 hypothetical protein [Mycoplasma zalophidermidis]MCR8966384.1 hypothetical protein [Mycoplasma zalophidermidis]